MLLVDRSFSMHHDFIDNSGTLFDEESRWEAFTRSVFGNSGPVASLQGSVRFGMTFYTSIGGDVACGDTGCDEASCLGDKNNCPSTLNCMRCPTPSCMTEGSDNDADIITTAPKLNQFSTLKQMLSDYSPKGGTPTGDGIDYVRSGLAALAASTGEPTLLIITTDGSPDRCEDKENDSDFGLGTAFDGAGVFDGMEESLNAVNKAHNQGINSFIISVGSGSLATSHLQQMANIGLGLGQYTSPGADYYVATDTAGLVGAINDIIGDTVSCSLKLSQTISADKACNGQVTYNGTPLVCDPLDDNGWVPGTPDGTGATDFITLKGSACTTLKQSGGTVAGAFPCEAIIVD